jgi:hypothetical protein
MQINKKKNNMDLETLHKANLINDDLQKWKDISTRLSCGNAFFALNFEAIETKSMPTKYTLNITDKKTIDTYKEFVEAMIQKCWSDLEKL